VRIAIVGAGPGGLATAKRLLDEGFDDFVVLERQAGVGGTWYQNRYPGCECDVPSAYYSFSWELKTDWSKPFGRQPEILAYLEDVAERYGILPHCRFGVTVTGATWDEARARWTVALAGGETVEADVVISALGMFTELAFPDIPGLDSFAGTCFHSARWDWDHDLAGETVGVIGSAASAVQLVPEIVETAAQVHLFQRSANWVLPKPDDPYTEEQLAAFRHDPAPLLAFRAEVERSTNENMTLDNAALIAKREQIVLDALAAVEDAVTRAKLTPTSPYGCKRPLFANGFYPAFNRPNLELVTEPIQQITEDSVVTDDGVARRVDTLVLATGFRAAKFLSVLDVAGRNGRHLDDAWRDGAQAYLGVTTAGFPNLFMCYGPNTNNGSILTMIEAQVEHIVLFLHRLAAGAAWVDVRPEAQVRYNDELQDRIAGVTAWHAGCHGYYRAESGRLVTQWPGTMTEYAQRTSVLDEDAFEWGASG
jgi:cation diffusion facilitator CzcD-associated flavoprotein CzcO